MKIFLRFFKYLRNYIKPFALANLFMLLFVFFSVISIALIMPFIDLLFRDNVAQAQPVPDFSILDLKDYIIAKLSELTFQIGKSELLTYICILMIVSFLIKNICSYFQTYFMSTVEQGIIQDIRFELYDHLHKLSLNYFTEEKKGNLISRVINDVKIINDSIMAVINSLFRDPPQIIIYTILLFVFNWELTLLILLLFPITGLILSKIGDSLKRKSIQSQIKIADLTTILDETLSAMRIVKAFNMEEYESQRFKKENNKYFSLLVSLVRKRALASPITEIISVAFITLILYFIGQQIISGQSSMTPGSFLLYLGLIVQMMPSLKLFGQVFNSVKEGIAASERVFMVMDTDPQIVDKPTAQELFEFSDSIKFTDVSFKYDTSDYVLQDLNVTFNKGEINAIVGPSGAGKSTLVDLIPRFYDPVNGSVSFDNYDLRDLKVKSIRDKIGIVTQETILFNDTIKNNITYGSSKYNDEEVIDVAKVANAHDFIIQLSNGYDTYIGDRGVKLSGGQRQRISIARALLKNPPILIFDEATSALDTESELLVQQAIERLMKGRTSIVIAHRLSTIMNAHKIIVLDKGKIVEIGTHTELIDNNGLYRKLYQMQFK